jgi:hypothetical protein
VSVNRSRLDWGVFCIVLGGVLLLVNVGLIDRASVNQLAFLWPVVLIALGCGLLLRYSRVQLAGGLIVAITLGLVVGSVIAGGASAGAQIGCSGNGAGSKAVTTSGSFGASASVDAQLSCVDLTLDSQPGSGWSVSAGSDSVRQPTIEPSADRLRLRSEPERFFGPGPRLPWHISVPQSMPVGLQLELNVATGDVKPGPANLSSLNFTLNASDFDFDLHDATALGSFGGTLNAASSTLILPTGVSALSGGITLNASSLTLCVAPSTNVQIELSETLSSNNFAAAGLVKSGNQWVTSDTGSAGPALTMHMSTNVSSVTLDRSGECR